MKYVGPCSHELLKGHRPLPANSKELTVFAIAMVLTAFCAPTSGIHRHKNHKEPASRNSEEKVMTLVRRHFLQLAAVAAITPAGTDIVLAQAPQGGPKLTQILRGDLQGQDQKVQESVANLLEMPSGAAAPWHMHPGAQELLFVIEGSLMVEIEGRGMTALKAGEIVLIPAEIPHLARNDGNGGARALVI